MNQVAIIAKTAKIEGLETWLPPRNGTMTLCEKQTGPFVTLKDYLALQQQIRGVLVRVELHMKMRENHESFDDRLYRDVSALLNPPA